MNENYKDIVIDGELHSGSFHGEGIYISKNLLRKLITYKRKFKESYDLINNILYNKNKGAGFEHISIDTSLPNAKEYIEDVRFLAPNISVKNKNKCDIMNINYPEHSVLADGIGIKGKGSVLDIAEKIIISRPSVLYFDGEEIIDTDDVWSGNFKFSHIILSTAHFTNFSESGWDHADGNTNGEYMALSSKEGDYSIFFVNNSPEEKNYSICVRCMGKADSPIKCIETRGTDNGGIYFENWFKSADKILPFKKSYGYCYNIKIKPYSMMTCTTLDTINDELIDIYRNNEQANRPKLPLELLPEKDIFPLMDINGNFETDSSGGILLKQDLYVKENESKYAVFGSKELTEYKLTAEVLFASDNNANYAGIGILCTDKGEYGYTIKIYPDGKYTVTNCNGESEVIQTEYIYNDKPNTLEITSCDGIVTYRINGHPVYNTDITVAPASVAGYAMIISSAEANIFKNVAINKCQKRYPYCKSYDCFDEKFIYSEGWIKNNYDDDDFSHRTSIEANEKQSFEFEFAGESIALFGKTKELRIKVEMDNAIIQAGDISGTDHTAYQAFYIKTGLKNALHKIKLTVISGKLRFSEAKTYSSGLKKIKNKAVKKSSKNQTISLGTVLAGAGLAAAGLGAVLIGKSIRKRKNKKKKTEK